MTSQRDMRDTHRTNQTTQDNTVIDNTTDNTTANAATHTAKDTDTPDTEQVISPLTGQPFAAPDLVLAQVGWRDKRTGQLFELDKEKAFDQPRHLSAVYEIAGRHYTDPEPCE